MVADFIFGGKLRGGSLDMTVVEGYRDVVKICDA